MSSVEERASLSKRNSKKEIILFKKFIEEMKLVNLPTMGGKFTWLNNNGRAMSRLDRFLLSENYIEDWKVVAQSIGAKDISDHTPIWRIGDPSLLSSIIIG